MEQFFNETFAVKSFDPAEIFTGITIGNDLREELIKKYITDVYYEQDGIVYRRNSAPRYYIPEIIFSPDIVNKVTDTWGSQTIEPYNSYFAADVNFRDRDGNIITSDISIYYSMKNYSESKYEYIYIASELPLIEIK